MKEGIKKTNRKRTKLKIFMSISCVLLLYIGITIGGIYKYLKEYGYGVKELPQTVAVYFHLDDGFTVKEKENGSSVFIGRENLLFYNDLIKKYGYREIDRLGTVFVYKKEDSEEITDFTVSATGDWCHWFRVYVITNDYKIEDFK